MKKHDKVLKAYNDTKPPMGVIPRDMHNCCPEGRKTNLKAGIRRYLEADLPINLDWIAELNELIRGE